MRIDYEYIKNLLDVFPDSEVPTVDYESFKHFHQPIENEHKFVFHIEILGDKALIASSSEDFGILGFKGEQGYDYIDVPWRLTAASHDFAAALDKPTVLEAIKGKF